MHKEFSTFTEVRQKDLPNARLYVGDEIGRNWEGTEVVPASVWNHLYNSYSVPADGENIEWNWCQSPVCWMRLICHGSCVNVQHDWLQHMTWCLQNTTKIPKPLPVLRPLHCPALVFIPPSSMQSRGDAHPCRELKERFFHQPHLLFTHPRKNTSTSQLFSCS